MSALAILRERADFVSKKEASFDEIERAFANIPVQCEVVPYFREKGKTTKVGNVEISKGLTRLESGGLIEVRQRIDLKKNAAYLASGREGDCLSQSMRLYLKLRGAGAVRVRGTRVFDRSFGDKPRHYWVENKGYVFEESLGVQHIYKKEDFYKGEVIQDVEYAQGCFFDDEGLVPEGCEKQYQTLTTDQLLLLIQCYERRVDYELYGGNRIDETLYQKKFNNVL